MKNCVLILLCATLATLCAVSAWGKAKSTRQRDGVTLSIQREFHGTHSAFVDRGFMVVQRPEIWEALWTGQAVPDVDFSTQSVIVALMGRQANAGADIRITEVSDIDGRVVVTIDETTPAESKTAAPVITAPYDMAVVRKITAPVTFALACALPPVPILDGFLGTQSNISCPRTVVIRDETSWRALWREAFGTEVAQPEVDFSRNMAVAIFAGSKPTGGYQLTIPLVTVADDRITVHYRLRSPAPDQAVVDCATAPYAIAVIPTCAMPVVFHDLAQPLESSCPLACRW